MRTWVVLCMIAGVIIVGLVTLLVVTQINAGNVGIEEDPPKALGQVIREFKPVAPVVPGSNVLIAGPGNEVNIPLPVAVGHYLGQDQHVDACQRDEVKMPDGKCYHLLSQGPCKPNEQIILNPKTNKPMCVPRLCAPDRIFVFSDQLCHDPKEDGICPPGRELFTTSYGTPICSCPYGTYEGDDDLDDDVCEPLLGPSLLCPPEQVFWFRDFKSPPQCVPDPCQGQNLNRGPVDLPFIPSKDGTCYQLAKSQGVCQAMTWYSLVIDQLQGKCATLEEAGYFIFDQKTLALFGRLYGNALPRKTSAPVSSAITGVAPGGVDNGATGGAADLGTGASFGTGSTTGLGTDTGTGFGADTSGLGTGTGTGFGTGIDTGFGTDSATGLGTDTGTGFGVGTGGFGTGTDLGTGTGTGFGTGSATGLGTDTGTGFGTGTGADLGTGTGTGSGTVDRTGLGFGSDFGTDTSGTAFITGTGLDSKPGLGTRGFGSGLDTGSGTGLTGSPSSGTGTGTGFGGQTVSDLFGDVSQHQTTGISSGTGFGSDGAVLGTGLDGTKLTGNGSRFDSGSVGTGSEQPSNFITDSFGSSTGTDSFGGTTGFGTGIGSTGSGVGLGNIGVPLDSTFGTDGPGTDSGTGFGLGSSTGTGFGAPGGTGTGTGTGSGFGLGSLGDTLGTDGPGAGTSFGFGSDSGTGTGFGTTGSTGLGTGTGAGSGFDLGATGSPLDDIFGTGTGTGTGTGFGFGSDSGTGTGFGTTGSTGLGTGTGAGSGFDLGSTGSPLDDIFGTGTGTGTGTGFGFGSDSGTGTGFGTTGSTGLGTGTGAGSGFDVGSTGATLDDIFGTGTGTGTGTGFGFGSDSGTGSGFDLGSTGVPLEDTFGTGTGTGTGFGFGSDSGTGIGFGATGGTRPGTGTGSGFGLGSTGVPLEDTFGADGPGTGSGTGTGFGFGTDSGTGTGLSTTGGTGLGTGSGFGLGSTGVPLGDTFGADGTGTGTTGTGFGLGSGTDTAFGATGSTGLGTGTGSGFGLGSTGTTFGSGTGTGTGVGFGSDTGAGTGTGFGTFGSTGSGTGSGFGLGSTGAPLEDTFGTGTGTGFGFGSDTGTGFGSGLGTGSGIGDSGTGTGLGFGAGTTGTGTGSVGSPLDTAFGIGESGTGTGLGLGLGAGTTGTGTGSVGSPLDTAFGIGESGTGTGLGLGSGLGSGTGLGTGGGISFVDSSQTKPSSSDGTRQVTLHLVVDDAVLPSLAKDELTFHVKPGASSVRPPSQGGAHFDVIHQGSEESRPDLDVDDPTFHVTVPTPSQFGALRPDTVLGPSSAGIPGGVGTSTSHSSIPSTSHSGSPSAGSSHFDVFRVDSGSSEESSSYTSYSDNTPRPPLVYSTPRSPPPSKAPSLSYSPPVEYGIPHSPPSSKAPPLSYVPPSVTKASPSITYLIPSQKSHGSGYVPPQPQPTPYTGHRSSQSSVSVHKGDLLHSSIVGPHRSKITSVQRIPSNSRYSSTHLSSSRFPPAHRGPAYTRTTSSRASTIRKTPSRPPHQTQSHRQSHSSSGAVSVLELAPVKQYTIGDFFTKSVEAFTDGFARGLSDTETGKLLSRTKRNPLPHATPANVFESRLAPCRSGAARDTNAKCKNTILPSSARVKRQSTSFSPPVEPSPKCPKGQVYNILRVCTTKGAVDSSINSQLG